MGCYVEGRNYNYHGEEVKLIKEMDIWDKNYKDALVYNKEEDLYRLIDKDYLKDATIVEEGLLVRGLESADGRYVWTDSEMKAGIVKDIDAGDIRIKVIRHSDRRAVGKTYRVQKNTFFDFFEEIGVEEVFSVGDYVKGDNDKYDYTDSDMLAGKIVKEYDRHFKVKIVKHESSFYVGDEYWIDKDNFAEEFVLTDNPVPFQPKVEVGDVIEIIQVNSFYREHNIKLGDEMVVVAVGEDKLKAKGLLPCDETFVVQNKRNEKLCRIGYYGETGNWVIL